MAFPEYLIGTWKIEESQPISDYIIRELDFADSDTMITDIEYSKGAYYNIKFQYEFIEQNKIKIEGRSGDEWQIERKGDLLVIHSTSWPGNRLLVYKRIIPINWSLIVLIIGILTIETYLVVLLEIKQQALVVNTQVKDTRALKNILRHLVYFSTFILGALIGLIIWSWPPLLRIRLPWDSIIMFELSTVILITRLMIIRTKYFLLKISTYSVERWLPILGSFLLGFGLCGLGISLMRLILYLMYESYLN